MILRKESGHTKGYSRRLCDYIILGTKKVINNIQQLSFFFLILEIVLFYLDV